MTFGTALELLKMGLAVRHSSWNEEEFIYLTTGTEVSRENLRGNCAKFHPSDYERDTINISSHIDKHISEEKKKSGREYNINRRRGAKKKLEPNSRNE